jgi:hypothetical protein
VLPFHADSNAALQVEANAFGCFVNCLWRLAMVS